MEELRPKILDDFIGNERIINTIHNYFRGETENIDATLLISDPGLGKTTLAHCFANHYGLDPLEINGSDERNKKDIIKTINALRNKSLSFDYIPPKEKLLILDECEPIRTDSLLKLLDKKGKKFFLCNEAHKISYKVKSRCMSLTLRPPTQSNYRKFIKEKLKRDPPDKEIIKSFKSWRDCINWYYGGDFRNTTLQTELQQAQEIFNKESQHQEYDISTERLLEYYIHNGGDQSIASLLHLKMNQSSLLRHVVRDVLFSLRLPNINRIGYYGPKTIQKERKRVKFLGFLE